MNHRREDSHIKGQGCSLYFLGVKERFGTSLRLVFTSDGVVNRSVKHYDLVKTKPRSHKPNTDSAYVSIAHDQVKTVLSELQAEAEE